MSQENDSKRAQLTGEEFETVLALPPRRVRILVVDDEPDLALLVRQRFRRQIRSGEFDFCFAGNGVEALQVLHKEQDIDIILTDINMPVMDGLTLLNNLKNYLRLHRTVIVSAYGDLGNIRTAMNRGAYDFVTKPIDFQDLEQTLTRTVDQLETARMAMNEHSQLQALRKELDIAATIQKSILPSSLSGYPTMDVQGRMISALEVGGDFFDYFPVANRHLGAVIGDVSGKGISSALFMAVCRTLIKATAQNGLGAADCVTSVNRMLASENQTTMFTTAFYAVIDPATGMLNFCNAGHNPTLILRHGEGPRILAAKNNLMLAIEEEFVYEGGTFQLEAGDIVILYTDGVNEAETVDARFYGTERLIELLATLPNTTDATTVVDSIIASVQEFAEGAPQSDDITVLALKWLGPPDPSQP
jgi:sigma-B regulation protein RsbU (phosphoserine phosphatase)